MAATAKDRKPPPRSTAAAADGQKQGGVAARFRGSERHTAPKPPAATGGPEHTEETDPRKREQARKAKEELRTPQGRSRSRAGPGAVSVAASRCACLHPHRARAADIFQRSESVPSLRRSALRADKALGHRAEQRGQFAVGVFAARGYKSVSCFSSCSRLRHGAFHEEAAARRRQTDCQRIARDDRREEGAVCSLHGRMASGSVHRLKGPVRNEGRGKHAALLIFNAKVVE